MNQKQRDARKTPEGKAKEAKASRISYYREWGEYNFPKWPPKQSTLCPSNPGDSCEVCDKVRRLDLAVDG